MKARQRATVIFVTVALVATCLYLTRVTSVETPINSQTALENIRVNPRKVLIADGIKESNVLSEFKGVLVRPEVESKHRESNREQHKEILRQPNIEQQVREPHNERHIEPNKEPHSELHSEPNKEPHSEIHSEPHNESHSELHSEPHKEQHTERHSEPHKEPHSESHRGPHSVPHNEPHSTPHNDSHREPPQETIREPSRKSDWKSVEKLNGKPDRKPEREPPKSEPTEKKPKREPEQESARPCKRKDIEGASSFVCVCSSTYCDQIPSSHIGSLSTTYDVYTSTMTGDRLTKRQYNFSSAANASDHSILYTLHKRTIYQAMLGFGGAFTDSAGINIVKLSKPVQDHLINAYFSSEGIEYTLGRIPMASCDFSTHPYSYDDYPNDFELKNFSLTVEDTKYKIPFILQSLNASGRYVRLFGSPWSGPAWMKDSGEMKGKGRLIGNPGGKYYKTWAKYFVRFIEEYAKHGIDMWGLTVENEPAAGNMPGYGWQAMYLSSEMERDFIKMDLGPALKENKFSNVALMILDDQRFTLPKWVDPILNDPDAASYVSGIGVHWYWDNYTPASVLTETHNNHPDKFILGTEACAGSGLFEKKVILGSWERGEDYSHDIIEDLNNWVTGWVDWNIALDLEGGPNWVQNFVDSPIIVDAENDIFYKQPMYYHLGHFSKFVEPGSWRIDYDTDRSTQIESIIVQQADLSFVAVFLNRQEDPVDIHIVDPLDSDRGVINAQIPARSIQTYHWKPSHTD